MKGYVASTASSVSIPVFSPVRGATGGFQPAGLGPGSSEISCRIICTLEITSQEKTFPFLSCIIHLIQSCSKQLYPIFLYWEMLTINFYDIIIFCYYMSFDI